MERTEPTLEPEWLKNARSLTRGGSISHSDDNHASRIARNNPFVNGNGNDFGRSSKSDRTTSSYFRSANNNSYSHPKSYSSFGRNQRDREWEKDISVSRDESKLLNNRWRRDVSDPLTNTFSGKFERDGLRHSQSMISGKRADTWHKKVVNDLNSAHGDNSGLLAKGSSVGWVNKSTLGRDFRSLGVEVGRNPSPGLSSAIQSLTIGTSASIGGDKWKASAEAPVIVGSKGTATQSASSSATSVALGTTTSLNMAKAVAQGSSRAQTSSQLTVETQRLEELAIKQSKQLIPVTPSMQRTSVVSPSDKLKPKVGQQQHSVSSSLPVNHSPRMKGDISKASSTGNLHILKPVREKSSITPVQKDISTSTNGSQIASSTISAQSVSRSAATSKLVPDRTPILTVLEKRPTSQAQSRNDFFNLMRKKSNANSSLDADSAIAMTNSSPILEANTVISSSSSSDKLTEIGDQPAPNTPHADLAISIANSSPILDPSTVVPPSFSDKVTEIGDALAPITPHGDDTPSTAIRSGGYLSEERGEKTCNGDVSDVQRYDGSGKRHSSVDPIFSEEEEAAFLHSMGWEENVDEGDLTQEEINSFCETAAKYINSEASLRIVEALQSKLLLPAQFAGIKGICSD